MDGDDSVPTKGGFSALSPAHAGGRRRRSGKKLRLVKKKTVRRMLAKKGLKMRGGEPKPDELDGAMGGRRRRSRRRSHRRGMFGF